MQFRRNYRIFPDCWQKKEDERNYSRNLGDNWQGRWNRDFRNEFKFANGFT